MSFRSTIHALLCLASSTAAVFEIHDQFGDTVTLLQYGSELVIIDQSNDAEWKVGNVSLRSGSDPKKIIIGPNMTFGLYEYVIDKKSTKGPEILSYPCDDSSGACQSGPQCIPNTVAEVLKATHCMVNQNKVEQCGVMDIKNCEVMTINIPSYVCGATRHASVCRAWAAQDPGYADASQALSCFRDAGQFQLYFEYTKHWLPLGWYIPKPYGDQLILKCIDNKAKLVEVQICEKIDQKCDFKNIACGQVVKVDGSQTVGSISKIFVKATKIANPNDTVQSYIFAVNMPSKVTAAPDGLECSTIICTIEKSGGLFRVKWSIKLDDVEIERESGFESSSTKAFKVDRHGAFTCVAEIRLRICSPFVEYYKIVNSERINFGPCAPQNLVGVEAEEKASIVLPVVIGCIASVIIIAVILIVVLWVIPKFRAKARAKRRKRSTRSFNAVPKTTAPGEKAAVSKANRKEVCSIAGKGAKKITIVVDSGNSDISHMTDRSVIKSSKSKKTDKTKKRASAKKDKSKVSKSLKGKSTDKKQPGISKISEPSKSQKGKTLTKKIP